MGIIKAAASAMGGTLADSWLEVIEPENMGPGVISTAGVQVRRNDKRNQNKKGSENIITDGSIIHVGENMCMLLVDGGKVIDYCAEPGYYEVKNDKAPSLLNGQVQESLEDAFTRFRFGGISAYKQSVCFINLSEIRDIPFGTSNPINYFDNFYNAELYVRSHGYYTVKVINPILFYAEIARSKRSVTVEEFKNTYLAEFLNAYQTAIGKMSVDGVRVSHLTSKGLELSKYMANILDESWAKRFGIQVESVGIASITYDENSRKLIEMRSQGAMLSDAAIREGYVQGSVARGIEAAGSNSSGAVSGFMGVNMGMNSGGGFVEAAGRTNREQAQRDAESKQRNNNSASEASWKCECGNLAGGKFCSECGAERPALKGGFCPECGEKITSDSKFCQHCGKKL